MKKGFFAFFCVALVLVVTSVSAHARNPVQSITGVVKIVTVDELDGGVTVQFYDGRVRNFNPCSNINLNKDLSVKIIYQRSEKGTREYEILAVEYL